VLVAEADYIPLSQQLESAANRVVDLISSISIDCDKLSKRQECHSPCVRASRAAADSEASPQQAACVSPHLDGSERSPSSIMPPGELSFLGIAHIQN
jgi:hypothetical protein